MEINKKEIQKVSNKLRTKTSQVNNANYRDQNAYLTELMQFIDQTPILKEYIDSIYIPIDNISGIVHQTIEGYDFGTFKLDSDEKKRTNFLCQVLKTIANENISSYKFGMGYTSSKKFDDMARQFSYNLVLPFIRNIEGYLVDISADMGTDREASFYIEVRGGQVNVAQHNAHIEAIQNNSYDTEVTKKLDFLKEQIDSLEDSDSKEVLNNNLIMIENQLTKQSPDKGVLNNGLKTLKLIGQTIIATPQFIQSIDWLSQYFINS
ncbi:MULTISPECIES: hypothetical protein [Aerococcus]|uniref:Uncharacterized protein n=1 Tax=Aerococcus urinae TaxID=1376 RepID=A0A329P692_9LACT|nr:MULTISPECIES: hypothetical protein [Aerococcus]MDK6729051.1 hypothetical protein [Aerococcus urinae]RAV81454.1 hypothetical protein DBT54_00860 [Aerococcus loyolae]